MKSGHKDGYGLKSREWYITECPACQSEIVFNGMFEPYGIDVNIESGGQIYIPGMYFLVKGCNNPMCKWSKVKPYEEK